MQRHRAARFHTGQLPEIEQKRKGIQVQCTWSGHHERCNVEERKGFEDSARKDCTSVWVVYLQFRREILASLIRGIFWSGSIELVGCYGDKGSDEELGMVTVGRALGLT